MIQRETAGRKAVQENWSRVCARVGARLDGWWLFFSLHSIVAARARCASRSTAGSTNGSALCLRSAVCDLESGTRPSLRSEEIVCEIISKKRKGRWFINTCSLKENEIREYTKKEQTPKRNENMQKGADQQGVYRKLLRI